MASTTTLYENEYILNLSKSFRDRFNLLPQSEPEGNYIYHVWIEERKNWLNKTYCWCSEIRNASFRVVNKNETLSDYGIEDFKRLAFIAELVNYAQKFDYWKGVLGIVSPHYNLFHLSNFNIGDTLNDSNFEISIHFDSIVFNTFLDEFESFGLYDDNLYTYNQYQWKISKTKAQMYFADECIYNHPKPMYVLAVLGWFIASNAR